MKVIFPITKFYPVQSGGPIYTLLWHCKALKREGVSVKIFTTTTGFNSIKSHIPKKNTVLNTEMGDIVYRSGSLAMVKNIKSVINEASANDIVHLNSFFSPISFLTFLALKAFRQKTKVVWSVRGEFNKNAINFNTKKKIPILKLIRPKVGNVLFHSTSIQETKDIKTQFSNANVIEVPNFIELHPKVETPKKNEILFLGRIHPIKNIEHIIEAIQLSKAFKKSNYKLKIVGKYEERYKSYYDSLVHLVNHYKLEQHVEFIDHIVGMAKWQTYAQAKFLCLPSKTENFGNVVVEALSQGTPVIASLGTPWESLNTQKAGYHVSNAPQSLALVFDDIVNLSKAEYKTYCINALQLCRGLYDINSNIKRWIQIYNTMLIEKAL